MEASLLKMILCSALFLLFYKVVLEREKTLKFNRFYLLFSLVLSTAIPFISVELPAKDAASSGAFETYGNPMQNMTVIADENTLDYSNLLIGLYSVVVVFLVLKMGYSLYQIFKLKGNATKVEGIEIIKLKGKTQPFAFWNKIYIGEIYFETNFDVRIIKHEEAHIRQKHTIDLLFVEVFKIIFWFNPVVYLFKKLIIDNHEYLADEAVLADDVNLKEYQKLILNETINANLLKFSHSFNFNTTKKRFKMMTTKKSKFQGAKKVLLIPVVIGAFALFVDKTYARNPTESINDSNVVVFNKGLKEASQDDKEYLSTIKLNKVGDTIPKTKKQTATKVKSEKGANDSRVPPPPPPPPAEVFEQAEFPGGYTLLRKAVAETFDTSKISHTKGNFNAEAYISVNKQGKVTQVLVDGKDEDFNSTLKSTVEKVVDVQWKPALADGKEVNTVFRLPVAINFQ